MKIKKHWRLFKENQSGIASMVIVILIMTLLTLVVLAMTRNSNREQQQALDRQLSTQAFYAAESGISDAKDFVADPPSGASLPLQKNNCNGIGAAEGTENQFPDKISQVGEFENTRYTCVLYNRIPNELRYSSVDVKTPVIVPIEDQGGLEIRSLTFNWTQEDGGTDFSGCPLGGGNKSLPNGLPADCEAGLLRIELVDPNASGRQQLIDNTFLVYVKPTKNGTGSYQFPNATGPAKQGDIINAQCSQGECSFTVDFSSVSKDLLYLNLRSIYKSNSVSITGITKPEGNATRFRNAQMEVDSTGQADNILKRVQANVDLSGINSSFIPGFVLQTSTDICKRLEVEEAGGTVENEC